ncbi:MAG TPA: hypothetical protein DEG69_14100 [Flavobacteriaceae bacterium]|jgi:hypothetical protein|nr:hypothetical protein [Flavobacteriaceae bacterium]|tara:strand:+ start:537 stop:806 length:270 start_codon:yes stop_codon:yes gene_type:complete
MEFTNDKIKQLVKEELENILQEGVAERWAFESGLKVTFEEGTGQKMILLTNDEAAKLTLPTYPSGDPVDWDVQRRADGEGWVIYTGDYR